MARIAVRTVIMPKNKSEHQVIKVRIIFSHFSHPGKAHGRVVGRALSVLVNLAQELLPTWAILKIEEVREYTEELGRRLREWGGGGLGKQRTRLFELDVREMFPSLDRDRVLEGIRLVYEGVREALRKGVHGGRKVRVGSKGLIFGIHWRCKHLDKVGVGYASDYGGL